MINCTILVGRITKTPVIKSTQSDILVCRFTLAVNRSFKGGNGEQETDFIQCVAWRKQAENMGKFVDKGALLGIEGRIQTGSYYNKDGAIIYTTDVICDSVQFLEPKGHKKEERFTPPSLDELPFERKGYRK